MENIEPSTAAAAPQPRPRAMNGPLLREILDTAFQSSADNVSRQPERKKT